MTYFYFDIETIPSQDAGYMEKVRGEITAPAQFKKPESIEKWLEDNRETAAIEKVGKTSFDGGRGHVCTIAWAKDDSQIAAVHASRIEDEPQILHEFFSEFSRSHSEILVGHNILGFDLHFLRKRALVLGVKMPSSLNFPRDPKPWDKSAQDTMTMFAGGSNLVSMNELCEVLGIEGKDGFDGSMVAAAWAAGEHEKIAEYCKDDVRRTREIHRKFIAAGW